MPEVGDEKPAPNPEPAPVDALVSRGSALWIWTVLFVCQAALSYSLFAGGIHERPPSPGWTSTPNGVMRVPAQVAIELLSLVRGLSFLVAVAASVLSWVFLYQFFAIHVVPVVFLIQGQVSEERRRKGAAHFARWAYRLMIVAAIARVLPELIANITPMIGQA